MQEQVLLREKFNEFLRLWGLKAAFVAGQCGITVNMIYQFKSGRGLLSSWQSEKLKSFMEDYEMRISR